MSADPLVGWLRDPAVYPHRPAAVELIETHVSFVALAGEEVFKVKKAVRLPFVDATSLAARLHFCREELRLGRRLAAPLYRGLAVLRPTPTGPRFERLGEHTEPPEDTLALAVRMGRLPAERLLDRLLARGEVDNALLARLAECLASFHAAAERGPEVDLAADPVRLETFARDNLVALRAATWPAEFDPGEELFAFLEAGIGRFFAEHGDLLGARIAAGRAVDGHGDLHAGNVCVFEDELWIYDPVEFEPAFRRGDAALDLAFLTMDLGARGYRAAARWLAHNYAERAHDPDLARLLPFFEAYRALVRAKVGVLRAAQEPAEARAPHQLEALRYLHLAVSYGLPPALILMCGLPASGKSWLGTRAAAALGGAFHRSDVRRKQLAGRALSDRRREGYDQGLYSAEAKQRTYDALLEDARRDLTAGRSCVIDGSFLQRTWRDPFRALAAELGVPFVLLETRVEPEEARRRLEARALDPNEPSEADWNVYQMLAAKVEPASELQPAQHVIVNSGGPPEPALMSLLTALIT